MAYGLSTYAYFWRISSRAPKPLTVERMLVNTRELGGDVFQICDYPLIETYDDVRLADIRATAEDLGITLELGTRGIGRDHLARYLELAAKLDVTLVRSMMNTAEHRPDTAEATALLRASVPVYAERGVTLGLETYEQVSTDDLLAVIRAVDDPHLGVVLDPGNCVARLERPGTSSRRQLPMSSTSMSRTSPSPGGTAGSASPTRAVRWARDSSTTPI